MFCHGSTSTASSDLGWNGTELFANGFFNLFFPRRPSSVLENENFMAAWCDERRISNFHRERAVTKQIKISHSSDRP
jgi:hypothetical protein